MTSLPAGFRVARYRFRLALAQPWEARGWVGNVLRGAFGWAFKRACCVVEHRDCGHCLLHRQCAYAYVFETAPPPESARLRKLTDLPRPFVFEPAGSDEGWVTGDEGQATDDDPSRITHHASRITPPADELPFSLVLIGRAIEYLPYFVFTFLELGRRGLGPERIPFQVQTVTADLPDGGSALVYSSEDETLRDVNAAFTAADLLARAHHLAIRLRDHETTDHGTADYRPQTTGLQDQAPVTLSPPHPVTPSPCHPLTLRFLTPTRLRFEGESLRDIEFHHLLRALLRRLSALCYFHCGAELEVDFRDLIRRAEAVETVSSNLEWILQSRYSRRQERPVKISGFVGDLTFVGDFSPFFSLLAGGEWVHVGKGCVMGLGKYHLEVPR
jgi:hypothetical protein